jgi:hypothetical protein
VSWDPISSPCDYILLAGKKSPGYAEIVGASSLRKWDEREGFGLSGAFCVFKGRGLAKFSVRVRLYTVEQWAEWHEWRPLVDKLPTKRAGTGKDSGTLDIWHPLLELLDIKAVAVEEVVQPEQTDSGEWTIEIKFIEFRRPKIALAKPEGAAAAPPVDPIEELYIKPLTEQLQRLAAE